MNTHYVWASGPGEFPEVEYEGTKQECEIVAQAKIDAIPNYVESDHHVWVAPVE